jgi:HK97 family phage major capsid protein
MPDPIKFESQEDFNAAVGKAMALHGGPLHEAVEKALKPLTEKQTSVMQDMLEKAARDKSNPLPKGMMFARTVRALTIAEIERKGAGQDPDFVKAIAKKYFGADDPVIKSIEDSAKLKATASQAGDPASLGNMIAPQFADEFIELLRNKAIIRKIARIVPNPTGQITFRKQTLSGTAYWVGEGKPITASKPAIGQLQFLRKKLGVLYVVSNDLLRYGGAAVDRLMLDDMLAISAIAEDLSFLRGDGTAFTPSGLASLALSGQTFAQSGTTLAAIDTDYAQAKRLIEEANLAFSDDELHWLMVPRTYYGLWNAKPATDAGARPYRDGLQNIKAGENDGRLLGAQVHKTNQIPKTLGGGSDSENYLVHGPSLWIADTLNNLVDVFQGGAYSDGGVVVSGISNDETVIRLLRETDFNARYQEAITRMTGVTIS